MCGHASHRTAGAHFPFVFALRSPRKRKRRQRAKALRGQRLAVRSVLFVPVPQAMQGGPQAFPVGGAAALAKGGEGRKGQGENVRFPRKRVDHSA